MQRNHFASLQLLGTFILVLIQVANMNTHTHTNTNTNTRNHGLVSSLTKAVETVLLNWYLIQFLTGVHLTLTCPYWLMMKNQLHPIIWYASGFDQQARWTGVPKNTLRMSILVVMSLFPHTPLCISTLIQLTGAPNTTVRHFTGASLPKAQMWHP